MTTKQTVLDIDVRGKRVFVRVDFNVPLNSERGITDDTRIRAAVPTIQYLLRHGAAVILASHLGRPKGKVVEDARLTPVSRRLAELLGQPVEMAPDSIGPEVERMATTLQPGNVMLLENLRFHPEEEQNDPTFARSLASLADIYVDDAFGSAHRAHASTEGIARYLPAVAGLLMEQELDALGGLLTHPQRPFVVLVGGAKISGKIGVLTHLIGLAESFLIGGGMANTLLKAEGVDVAASLVEDDRLEAAREFLARASEFGRSVYLPIDVVVAQRPEESAECRVVGINQVPAGWTIVDIGPETVQHFNDVIAGAGTIFWNGPMGIFEVPSFAAGTRAIAEHVAASGAKTVVGGGDSVAAVEQMGVADRITHISTGGGASLEFLEGRTLPGVAVLRDIRPAAATAGVTG
ncbi:MAG TPA: phosphoglycerate kinase [Chloroflexota bacterium]